MPETDVLILTALKEEFDAVQTVFPTPWEQQNDVHGFHYATTLLNNGLNIALARSVSIGVPQTAITASRLISELAPRCLAMCGICAGRRGKVSPGDVIVAEHVYKYDAGKITAKGDHLRDITTYNLNPRWKMAAETLPATILAEMPVPRPVSAEHQTFWVLEQLLESDKQSLTQHAERKTRCPDWTSIIKEMKRTGLLRESGLALSKKGRDHVEELRILYPDGLEEVPATIHVAPLACGDHVIEDDTIFEKLETAVRRVIGLEMEGAAIGLVAEQTDIARMIVTKGVSDFADARKDDRFRSYAACASATFLLHFLSLDRIVADIQAQPVPVRSPVPPAPGPPEEDRVLAKMIALRESMKNAGEPTDTLNEAIRNHKANRRKGVSLDPGGTLSQRYHLEALLGSGGFAEVWRALDLETGQRVAVKVLHNQHRRDASKKERFFRGARNMATLDHPAIVSVLLTEAEDNGYHYFVMEYIDGPNFREAVRQGMNTDEVVRIIGEVGQGLAYAHERGLVHRDVKPGNILVGGDGHARLADFDLVRVADSEGGTRTGALGTFLYVAPEAMMDGREADQAGDIYGLAKCALFGLRGKALPNPLFESVAATIKALECSETIKTVLLTGTALQKERRYGSVSTFCQALSQACTPEDETPLDTGSKQETLEKPVISIPTRQGSGDEWMNERSEDRYGLLIAIEIGGVAYRFRYINPGTFLMGSPKTEEERSGNEVQHEVTITEGFWLGETPCTQALWEAVMGTNPSDFKGPDRPVDSVSWHDAMAFIKKLNGMEPALALRLPTEAEWEYACRAGTTTPFSFGANITTDQVNYDGENPYAGGVKGSYRGKTVDVKALPHNDWGLYQMHGNVWEWCSDWYGPYPTNAVTNHIGPGHGEYRVLRGGCWFNDGRFVRSACRGYRLPSVRDDYYGFRLARGQ